MMEVLVMLLRAAITRDSSWAKACQWLQLNPRQLVCSLVGETAQVDKATLATSASLLWLTMHRSKPLMA